MAYRLTIHAPAAPQVLPSTKPASTKPRCKVRFRWESVAAGRCPFRSLESDAAVFGMAVDFETVLVADDVVVVPAEGDQIVRVGGPAV
jgi:hypothetical protein